MCYAATILRFTHIKLRAFGPLIEQGLHELRKDLELVSKLFTQTYAYLGLIIAKNGRVIRAFSNYIISAHCAPNGDHELIQAKSIPDDISLEKLVQSKQTDPAPIAS